MTYESAGLHVEASAMACGVGLRSAACPHACRFAAGRVSSGGGGAAGGSSSVASLARLSDGAFVSGAKAHLSKRKAIDFVNYSVRPFGFLAGHE